ncbi:sulfotransferase family protein [Marinobacter sp. F4216]|uniref:sulfotransferase family protein n=1 Tax=Marinobacter sp. F4216 TaxID=2874281 RepID=UPI001CC04ECE|nr:sulfotransferase [Marinobacter sp. F4216]MBZ2168431.1 sulfotransferase domain-containing protein [Marinobacter sp. F4216]
MINFFIVGAPKCGTTKLYDYLRKHPEVFLPEEKEPHFFADDLGKYKSHKTEREFLNIYRERRSNQITGDASIFHMYSSVAMGNIYNHNPNAKIVVILRNPVEAAHSFHSQLLYTQDETERDFESAWRLIGNRQHGEGIPNVCKSPKVLNYREVFAYSDQLKRVYSYFPLGQVKVFFYDDLKKENESVTSELCKFLEIEPLTSDNAIINPNQVNRFPWISRILRHPPSWLKTLKRALIGKGHTKLYDVILDLNTIKGPREPMKPSFKRELEVEFRDEIVELEELLARDLSAWKI